MVVVKGQFSLRPIGPHSKSWEYGGKGCKTAGVQPYILIYKSGCSKTVLGFPEVISAIFLIRLWSGCLSPGFAPNPTLHSRVILRYHYLWSTQDSRENKNNDHATMMPKLIDAVFEVTRKITRPWTPLLSLTHHKPKTLPNNIPPSAVIGLWVGRMSIAVSTSKSSPVHTLDTIAMNSICPVYRPLLLIETVNGRQRHRHGMTRTIRIILGIRRRRLAVEWPYDSYQMTFESIIWPVCTFWRANPWTRQPTVICSVQWEPPESRLDKRRWATYWKLSGAAMPG